MAQTNVIPGAEAFNFGPLPLHGNLQAVSDVEEEDVAAHRILKRNGAILEGMGWQPGHYEATCVFVGPTFRADILRVRNQIRQRNEDVLVHPIYGSFQARCTRITGALNIPAEANSATITLTFIEAGLDPNQTAKLAQAVASKTQSLQTSADDLVTLAAFYTSPAAAGAVGSLVANAYAYATAAMDAIQGAATDPSLPLFVTQIEQGALAAIEAIGEDPAKASDVDRFDALSQCDQVYAAALEVQDALNSTRPPIQPYTVPVGCSYLVLLATLYGTDALDREGEFFLYNAGLPDPSYIPAGTVVYLPAAPIQQAA